jgi:prevent-host-death family protein
MAQERAWQASEARANLPAVMEGALAGVPQIIRKRTGEEVVVLSRHDYERVKPTLKDFLLRSAGSGRQENDPLDEVLREGRTTGTMGFAPRERQDS